MGGLSSLTAGCRAEYFLHWGIPGEGVGETHPFFFSFQRFSDRHELSMC